MLMMVINSHWSNAVLFAPLTGKASSSFFSAVTWRPSPSSQLRRLRLLFKRHFNFASIPYVVTSNHHLTSPLGAPYRLAPGERL